MKIKSKLIISFCIVTFIPIILSFCTLVGFQKIQKKSIEQNYGIEDVDGYSLNSSIQLLNRMTEENFNRLIVYVDEKPGKFEDSIFLKNFNEQLDKQFSYIVVKKNDEVIFNGGKMNDNVLEALPSFGTMDKRDNIAIKFDSDNNVFIKRIDFYFPDEQTGTVYLVTVAEDVVPEVKHLIMEVVVAIVIILVFTALLMIIWIY